ncbi:uncharacterized protein METZ01_LOCUS368229 [marine metagenome]|uniref:Uncharacterized protein n=1 Tax=marine metagenome TaxID=408172 RepID=A0A382T0W6_9ZZZZ
MEHEINYGSTYKLLFILFKLGAYGFAHLILMNV